MKYSVVALLAFVALAVAKPPAYGSAPAYPSEQKQAYPKPEPAYPKPPAEPEYPKPPAYPKPEPPTNKPMLMPFQYEWAVKDEDTLNDYSHKAVSDGLVENGVYRVLLPDGRTQIVTYKADENGYVADVQYQP